MGCSSSTAAPTTASNAPEVIAPGKRPDPQRAPAEPAAAAAAAGPAEPKEPEQPQPPRYPGFDKYPDTLRVLFAFEEKALIAGSQELGLRYAKACQELGASLGIEPAILAEAYADPVCVDANGEEVQSVQALPEAAWPVTFKFPKQRRKYNLLFGLDGAGKTSLLRSLEKRSGQPLDMATVASGCSVETLSLDDFTCFASWGVVGPSREPALELLREYSQDVLSVVFVVDSSDPGRMDEAQQVLAELLGGSSPLAGLALLVYANKRDVPEALPATEVAGRLKLASLPAAKCFVQSCCASSGDGVFQGIAWLSQAIGGTARTEAKGSEDTVAPAKFAQV